jgi:hypothetical protein
MNIYELYIIITHFQLLTSSGPAILHQRADLLVLVRRPWQSGLGWEPLPDTS